jgi:asparagine synthase (glutamine-hydrolysing)
LSDRPIGALLSGGVDSSLIAAIAARELAKEGKRLTTFSIGMPGSTDLQYAEQVAKHINSIHHTILLTSNDFLQAIPEVVKAIESYDITSVRASVGNYLVGKYIKENTDIKVVFNGDGSDEIGGGYIYFYAAPTNEEFEDESERLLREIHLYDVLRSDRCISSHGLEPRTPFLDKSVVATWRAIGTEFRRPQKPTTEGRGAQMEKQILREAFEMDNYLPFEVLWRKKEAFSDGVSATNDSWYKRCLEYAQGLGLSLSDIVEKTKEYHNPPKTEEAYWYRCLFEESYGSKAAMVIPRMWMPRWVAGASDPSARTLKELY